MRLTKANYRVFAAMNYDNPFCLNMREFEDDLFKVSVIKKMITAYIQKSGTNIKLLVNTTISLFNVFDHHALTKMIEFKLTEEQIPYANSLLTFLSLPTVSDVLDNSLLIKLRDEYK